MLINGKTDYSRTDCEGRNCSLVSNGDGSEYMTAACNRPNGWASITEAEAQNCREKGIPVYPDPEGYSYPYVRPYTCTEIKKMGGNFYSHKLYNTETEEYSDHDENFFSNVEKPCFIHDCGLPDQKNLNGFKATKLYHTFPL